MHVSYSISVRVFVTYLIRVVKFIVLMWYFREFSLDFSFLRASYILAVALTQAFVYAFEVRPAYFP